jgi:hypothetical protein
MQYKDKRNGEIVEIEKIDAKLHSATSSDHPYKVIHMDASSLQCGANYYISEARLQAQFEPVTAVKKEVKEMKEDSSIL